MEVYSHILVKYIASNLQDILVELHKLFIYDILKRRSRLGINPENEQAMSTDQSFWKIPITIPEHVDRNGVALHLVEISQDVCTVHHDSPKCQ